MRLKYRFETMELDGMVVAIPVGEGASYFHGVVKLNETAAYIFNALKETTSEEAIVESLLKEYNAPKELIAEDVREYLIKFREKGILTE